MHYHCEIWIPAPLNISIDKLVEAVMAPHKETYNEDTEESTGFWDWYQIGGRWTGEHTPDYEPEDDPRNIEDCELCGGTGFRRDAIGDDARKQRPSYTCNSCGVFDQDTETWGHGPHGAGKRSKWPTQWAAHKGDVIGVADVSADLTCHTLIVADKAFHQKEWDGEHFVETNFGGKVAARLAELGITDGFIVTVDYHC